MAEVLPTHYFHVVFSVPEQIASITYQNTKVVYAILFRAVAKTLSTIAADPKHLGAEIGFFAVLHSWGQTLVYHPHLHCVVPGGGISLDGTRWISCRPTFFLPVRVLSRLFRRLFLTYLEEAFDSGKLRFFSSLATLKDPQAFRRHLDSVRNAEWVVYAKPPFAGPQQVVDYVGRYTHRVAISNDRIVDIEGGEVKFTWRDYRDDNQQKTMTLTADEFIGRFLLHVLPSGFHRIRYYGFLANPHRQEKLEQCRKLLGMAPPTKSSSDTATLEDYRDRYERLTGRSLRECPVCHRGHMIPVTNLPGVSSPAIKDIVMIHSARVKIGLTKNSKPSSQRNCFVSRSSEQLAGNQVSCILPCGAQRNFRHRGPPASFQHLPTASSVFDLSISPIKTHSSGT